MNKLIFSALTLLCACQDVPLDLGPVDEAYNCKVVLSCDGAVEERFIARCAPHGHQYQLMAENHMACESELTARGCMKVGCDGWCEGKGVTEGDGVFRPCLDGSDVDAGVQ